MGIILGLLLRHYVIVGVLTEMLLFHHCHVWSLLCLNITLLVLRYSIILLPIILDSIKASVSHLHLRVTYYLTCELLTGHLFWHTHVLLIVLLKSIRVRASYELSMSRLPSIQLCRLWWRNCNWLSFMIRYRSHLFHLIRSHISFWSLMMLQMHMVSVVIWASSHFGLVHCIWIWTWLHRLHEIWLHKSLATISILTNLGILSTLVLHLKMSWMRLLNWLVAQWCHLVWELRWLLKLSIWMLMNMHLTSVYLFIIWRVS